MNRETHNIILSSGDKCEYELVEENHRITCVIPTVTLIHPKIPPEFFQDVLNHIISLNRDYIHKLYFDDILIKYRVISFKLFGHVRANLKNELKKPLEYNELVSGKEHYTWIEDDFLPRFPEDFDREIDSLEKRIKNIYWAFKKGKMAGVPYVLPEDYSIKYNYFFEVHETDIKPVFDVYINTNDPLTDGDLIEVSNMLKKKFESLDVNLIFKDIF